MKCHTNVNSIPPTQLSHTFSYIVAKLIHNHFESPTSWIATLLSIITIIIIVIIVISYYYLLLKASKEIYLLSFSLYRAFK
jgi:hypothetical protein